MVQTLDIAAIRAEMPAVTAAAYLNTGTFGPLPRAAHEAIIAHQQEDYAEGRTSAARWQTLSAVMDETRAMFARILGAGESEIALTHGTTYGMNHAVLGMEWQAGDEIVVTDMEHIGGLAAAYVLQQRTGVAVRFVDCTDPLLVKDRFRAAITPRTKAVVFSHVSWSNGYVFPVADIAVMAHQAGALAIIDGAQSAGALAVNVKALGVDAYAIPGQKWLCGPGDTGALYVDGAALDRINASFASYGSWEHFDEAGNFAVQPDARRFETGMGYSPTVYGLHASLNWQQDAIDRQWAVTRAVELADLARERLAGVQGAALLTPSGTRSGLTTFTFADWDPAAVVEDLADEGIVIRSIPSLPALRVSTGFYNNEDDIARLVSALKALRTREPHPPRVAGH
jgi:L-cysteine/cystine lyase